MVILIAKQQGMGDQIDPEGAAFGLSTTSSRGVHASGIEPLGSHPHAASWMTYRAKLGTGAIRP